MQHTIGANHALGFKPWRIWAIWLMACAFALYQFALQLSTGVMVSDIIRAFAIDAGQAGLFTGAFYLTYGALQTPAGLLMDRFGARFLLSSSSLVCALGCFLLAASPVYWLAFVSRILMGFGCAFAFVGAVHLIRAWFPSRLFSPLVGMMETMAMLNCLLSSLAIAAMVQQFSWQVSVQIFGCIALLISFGCSSIIRDRAHPTVQPTKPVRTPLVQSLKSVMGNPLLWINGLYGGILFLVVSLFAGLWAIPFLQAEIHCTLPQASFISSMIFVGAGIGCPFAASFAAKYNCYRRLFITAALSTSAILCFLLYCPIDNLTLLSIGYLLCGLTCSPYIVNYTLANHLAANDAKSTSVGFTNMLCVGSAPIFQVLTGYSVTYHHHVQSFLTDTQYNIDDFQFSLSILPLLMLFAALLANKLPDKIAS